MITVPIGQAESLKKFFEIDITKKTKPVRKAEPTLHSDDWQAAILETENFETTIQYKLSSYDIK